MRFDLISFELPTHRPTTLEYRFSRDTGICEVWCVLYPNTERDISEAMRIKTFELPRDIHIADFARKHYQDTYAPRKWDTQHPTEIALGIESQPF